MCVLKQNMPKRYVDEPGIYQSYCIIFFSKSVFTVKFVRYKQTWRIIGASPRVDCCLELLALKKGYCVADVCAALGGSQRRLYAVFMRDIGLPPKTWMNYERMVVAKRKLEGGLSIEQVFKDMGFLSVDTFRSRFMKTYGISPHAFVRRRKVFDPSRPLFNYPQNKSKNA